MRHTPPEVRHSTNEELIAYFGSAKVALAFVRETLEGEDLKKRESSLLRRIKSEEQRSKTKNSTSSTGISYPRISSPLNEIIYPNNSTPSTGITYPSMPSPLDETIYPSNSTPSTGITYPSMSSP